MKTALKGQVNSRAAQFGLLALLEYTTLCGILLGLSPLIGIPAAVGLMLMGLALGAGTGLVALAIMMVVVLLSDWPSDPQRNFHFGRPLLVVAVTAALCNWYRVRRRYMGLHRVG